MISGASSTALPAYDPSATVDATTSLGSGGTADWWGRTYNVEREGILVRVYRRGAAHDSTSNTALHISFSDDRGVTWTAEDTDLNSDPVSGFPLNPTGGNVSYGEGMPILAPNGDIVILMWRVDGNSSTGTPMGTYAARSVDGGSTWTSEGQVDFGGGLTQNKVFATDGWFTHPDGTTYTCGRVYNAVPTTDSYCILIKNESATLDVDSWAYVSDITVAGSDTQETGITYVGDDCIVALCGSLNNDETIQAISTNMGATWSTSDVTSTAASITRRHKLYTLAQLMGESGWWNDNRLIASCFENQVPGDSQDRRNALLFGRWNRSAKTVTWLALDYMDTTSEDGGYGDVWWREGLEFSTTGGDGTLAACAIEQYDVTVGLT